MSDGASGLKKIYAGINLEGRRALGIPDDLQLFEGFSDGLDPMLTTWLEFDAVSVEEVRTRVLEPLKKLEEETGIPLYLADRDFTFHTTLLQGKRPDAPEKDLAHAFADARDDVAVHDAVKPIIGARISYRYILFDKKANFILVSTEIPASVTNAREIIATRYETDGLAPVKIPILHSTLARMKELPEERQDIVLGRVKEFLIDLRHRISAQPIEMTVGAVRINQGFVSQNGPSAALAE